MICGVVSMEAFSTPVSRIFSSFFRSSARWFEFGRFKGCTELMYLYMLCNSDMWWFCVQATPLQARNNSSQYEPRLMPKEDARNLQRTPKYGGFLERVRGDVHRCLLQNSILDICADDFARMQEEEAIKGHRSDKPINEIMSCMDIRHCKDMQVSALRWHPQHQRLQGVCIILSFMRAAHA